MFPGIWTLSPLTVALLFLGASTAGGVVSAGVGAGSGGGGGGGGGGDSAPPACASPPARTVQATMEGATMVAPKIANNASLRAMFRDPPSPRGPLSRSVRWQRVSRLPENF